MDLHHPNHHIARDFWMVLSEIRVKFSFKFTHSVSNQNQIIEMWQSCRKSMLFYLTGFPMARTSGPFPIRVQHAETLLPLPSSSPIWGYSTTAIGTSKGDSFTVNYLINNCGFPPDSALSASKSILLRSSQKPNSVLALFHSLGFSDSHLRLIIRREPRLLLVNPHTLLPKLQFFQSKGASTSQLISIVTARPKFLIRSLENHLIPTYNLINGFLKSDERTIITIKRCTDILCFHGLQHNIMFLLDVGIREASLALLLRQWPSRITHKIDKLRDKVDELRGMGIDPSKAAFVPAMHAKMLPKSMWESKVELYKRWGWTDEAIHEAFVKHPSCMLISVRNIEEGMQFFVNRMGWDPLLLATCPILLSFSLRKRIIPRAFVLEFLLSIDLISSAIIQYAYYISEDKFLQKYVNCFKDQAPQLLKLYEEKMHLSGMDN